MKFQDHMNLNLTTGFYTQARPITCNSGLELSVQAGEGLYSSPRSYTGDYNSFSEFEIGFPSEPIGLLDYAEEPLHPTETVYTYVPAHLIQKVIDDNGGIILSEGVLVI